MYNQFDFSAQQNTVVGADYNFIIRNFNFFGEGARSANGGMAFQWCTHQYGSSMAFTINQRWFGKDFQNLHANTFGKHTSIQ